MNKLIFSLISAFTLTACIGPKPSYKKLEQEFSSSETSAQSYSPEDPQVKVLQEKFINAFSKYEQAHLQATLPDLYADNAYLNDRLAEMKGKPKIVEYFLEGADKVKYAGFDLQTPNHNGIDFYFPWVMKIQLKDSDEEPWRFHGISRVRFNQKGQIIFHYDYWDVAEFMAEVSAVRPIVNLFKSN